MIKYFPSVLPLVFLLFIQSFNKAYSQDFLPKLDPLKTIQRDTSNFYFKEIWIKSIDINKDDPEGFLRRASDKIELGYIKEALSDLDQAINIDSMSQQAYIIKGLTFMKCDSISSALKCFNKATSLNDTNLIANFYSAEIYAMTGKFEKADSLYKKIISLNDKFYHAYFSLANLCMINFDFKEAEKNFNKVIDLKPDYFLAYFNLALMYSSFDLNKALRSLNNAIRVNPNFANAYYLRGFIYWDQNLIKATYKDWNKAVEIEPNTTLFQISLGFLYIIDKDFNKGFNLVSQALINSMQKNLFNYFEQSVREKIMNDFISQVIIFNKYTPLLTSNEKEKIIDALCLFFLGKFKNAEDIYESLITNTSKPGLLYYLRGFNFEYLQQADRALESFNNSIRQDDFPDEAFLRKGIVLNFLKRYQESILIFKKFLTINDSVRLANRMLAGSYVFSLKYDSAIIQLTKLINDDSTELDIYFDRALCNKNLQKYELAEIDCEYILRYNPYNIETNCLLAECKFITGDTTNAYKILTRIWNKFNMLTESGHFIRGTINLYYAKYDSAIFDFTNVLTVNPEHAEALLYRGLCHYCKADFANAKTDLSSAIKLNNDDFIALYTRGLAHLKLNELNEAYEDLKKAESLGHPLAKRVILNYLKDFKPNAP